MTKQSQKLGDTGEVGVTDAALHTYARFLDEPATEALRDELAAMLAKATLQRRQPDPTREAWRCRSRPNDETDRLDLQCIVVRVGRTARVVHLHCRYDKKGAAKQEAVPVVKYRFARRLSAVAKASGETPQDLLDRLLTAALTEKKRKRSS